jgi:hypothetical protein
MAYMVDYGDEKPQLPFQAIRNLAGQTKKTFVFLFFNQRFLLPRNKGDPVSGHGEEVRCKFGFITHEFLDQFV